jgi:hypothetical protein
MTAPEGAATRNCSDVYKLWDLNSTYCPGKGCFKFVRKLNAFTNVRGTEAGER